MDKDSWSLSTGRVPSMSSQRDDRAVAVGSTVVPCDGPTHGVLAPVWYGQIVVRSCQVVARAFALSWSNSAWVIVPASRSCLADAI